MVSLREKEGKGGNTFLKRIGKSKEGSVVSGGKKTEGKGGGEFFQRENRRKEKEEYFLWEN